MRESVCSILLGDKKIQPFIQIYIDSIYKYITFDDLLNIDFKNYSVFLKDIQK